MNEKAEKNSLGVADGSLSPTQAGRELDAEVAECVMGWTRHPAKMHPTDNRTINGVLYCPPDYPTTVLGGLNCVPYYSTDIAAAMEVVEKMRVLKLGVCIDDASLPNPWFVDFDDGKKRGTATAPTLPEAICRAALATINGQVASE